MKLDNYVEIYLDDKLVEVSRNTSTRRLIKNFMDALAGNASTIPSHIGYSYDDSGELSPSKEIDRGAITTKFITGDATAKLIASFDGSKTGGLIKTVYLWDKADSTLTVDNCDSTSGWSTDTGGTLVLDTSVRYEGSGSLKVTSSNASFVSTFKKSTLNIDISSIVSPRLQFWYYVSDINALTSQLLVRLGSDANNYWLWNSWTKTAKPVTNGWAYYDLAIGDRDSMTGTVNPNKITYFTVDTNKNGTANVVERLDAVRIWSASSGNLLALARTNFEKIAGSILTIYWYSKLTN